MQFAKSACESRETLGPVRKLAKFFKGGKHKKRGASRTVMVQPQQTPARHMRFFAKDLARQSLSGPTETFTVFPPDFSYLRLAKLCAEGYLVRMLVKAPDAQPITEHLFGPEELFANKHNAIIPFVVWALKHKHQWSPPCPPMAAYVPTGEEVAVAVEALGNDYDVPSED